LDVIHAIMCTRRTISGVLLSRTMMPAVFGLSFLMRWRGWEWKMRAIWQGEEHQERQRHEEEVLRGTCETEDT